jgi:Uma2 family endonuclease
MSEPAPKAMTVDEFLRWEDGTDTRYELVRGEIRRRDVASAIHSTLLARLGSLIHDALTSRTEHLVLIAPALAIPGRDDTCYLADIAVAPTPERWGDPLITDPLLVIEIVSPESFRHDLYTKRPDYMSIDRLHEIVCLNSDSVLAEAFRCRDGHWLSEVVQGRHATLSLTSIGIEISMAVLYDGLPIFECVV